MDETRTFNGRRPSQAWISRWEPPLLLVAMLLPTVVTYFYFCHFSGDQARTQRWVYGIAKGIQFSLPAVWMLGVLRRTLGDTTSADTERTAPQSGWLFPAIAFGLLAGVTVFLSQYLLAPRLTEFDTLRAGAAAKVRGLGLATPGRYLALSAFYSVVHSFLEEYYWRWFVFARLREYQGHVRAAIVSSIGFMLHHVLVLGSLIGWGSALPYLLSLGVAVGGFVWASIYHRSGRLVPVWISHALVDAAIFAVGYSMIWPRGGS